MRRLQGLASLALGLSLSLSNIQCGRSSPSRPVFGASLPAGSQVTAISDSAGVVTAAIGANAKEAQLLKASADSNISNVSVAFPVGSLAIDTNITLSEGTALDNSLLLGELSLNAAQVSKSGTPVTISSSKPIDLKTPMILALPIPLGLSLAVSADNIKKLGVVYRIQSQETGANTVGFVPATELRFDNDNNILYPSKFFGWFQVVVFDREVPKTENVATISLHEGVEIILTAMAMPSCGKADLGRTVYVQDLAQFQYCATDGWKVIDLRGPAGTAGTNGSIGLPGSPGPIGPAASSLFLYSAGPTKLGLFLSVSNTSALAKIGTTAADLGIVGIDLDQARLDPRCASNLGCNDQVYFKTNDCQSRPYLSAQPLKYAVIVSGTSYFRALGTESVSSYGPFESRLESNGSCSVSPFGNMSTYSIDTSYSKPSGQAGLTGLTGPIIIDL